MAPGVKGRGIYIPPPSSSLRSSPIPLSLRPRHSARHTEDAAATPPDASRRHHLTRVRGPHATPRADDLVVPLLPGRPRQTRGHTGTVRTLAALTRRDDEAAKVYAVLPLLHSQGTLLAPFHLQATP